MSGFNTRLPNYVSECNGTYELKRSISDSEILNLAQVILAKRIKNTIYCNKGDVVKEYCITRLGNLEVEQFAAIWLDTKLQIIDFEVLAVGTLSATSVFPREVVRSAIKHNAGAVIFTHNHPSGNCVQASHADVELTNILVKSLKMIEVRVLDHIIVSGNNASSMASLGILQG